ncbi:MAG: hypothetical protein ACI9US_001724 [Gammaproteobacteria bacterium]|jgi:hypothetical protein
MGNLAGLRHFLPSPLPYFMAAKDKLTHNACLKVKPEAGKPRKTLSDGLGLKLKVTDTSKLWRFDYTHKDKQKSLSLVSFPKQVWQKPVS